MKNHYINQYILLFFFSWAPFYIIYPVWALPISVNGRFAIFLALIIYFFASAFFMNRWMNDFDVDKPCLSMIGEWKSHIKDNVWLIIVCTVAVILHIRPIFSPMLILGDEPLHITSGLWIYEYINYSWHKFFQIIFWMLTGFIIVVIKLKVSSGTALDRLKSGYYRGISNKLIKYLVFILALSVIFLYFYLLRNMVHHPMLVRYPPIAKFLYFTACSAFGINGVVPRIIQLSFYVLSGIYLYRTVCLFYRKETALFGTTVYLFSPLIFAYAGLGELASGTNFFIIIISFYFIRYLKDGDKRDLLLAAYLIGTGFLYKRVILLMFFACFAFLVAHSIKKRNLNSLTHLKILLLSLVPIVPWMVIGKFFTWRNYSFQLSNFFLFDGKMLEYLTLISSSISMVVFILFILSIIFNYIFKRNLLTSYFGVLFILYYLFYVSDIAAVDTRLSMSFYPSIAVFLSLFIPSVIQSINWRYAFQLFFFIFTAYLIVICTVSPLNKRFLTAMNLKLHRFPSDRAMLWAKDNVKDGEKILTMRVLTDKFYRNKYEIDRNKIISFWYELEDFLDPGELKTFYIKNHITYLMFPFSANYPGSRDAKVLKYLKENKDNEFAEVERFCLDDKCIYVYQLVE